MKSRAALSFDPEGPFAIEDVELDEPRSDEVLVRVSAAGICHTDLMMKGRWPAELSPIVLGHEGAGIVEAVGDAVTSVRAGDHVVMSFRSCTTCTQCGAGHPAYCENFMGLNMGGTRPDGSTTMTRDGGAVYGSWFGQSSFASHALAYESNLVVIADDVDFTTAAPLGCGIQTGAGTILNVLRPDADSSVVVFGAGGVGLGGVMAAKAAGVKTIIVVEPVAGRREIALAVGATDAVDPNGPDGVVDSIREITTAGATHALDTTAVPAVIDAALQALATRGTLALVGAGAAEASLDLVTIGVGGKVVRGVVEGDATPQDMVPRLLELHAAGRLPLEQLIKTYPFDDINTAVADAESGATIKPVLVF